MDRRGLKHVGVIVTAAVAVGMAMDGRVDAAGCTCTYSTGAAPDLTSYPVSLTMSENATITFSATAVDADTKTTVCESSTTTVTESDGATCVWTAGDGEALSDLRGTSFTWRSPQLEANECSRVVTITVMADDTHTSNPCPCGNCGGDRNDSPADSQTVTITVTRDMECDNDGNGTFEDCKHCDNNHNGTIESCYACPATPAGGPKTRCANCDFNNDGFDEGCSTPITNLEELNACDNLVQVGQPGTNGCTGVPDNPCGRDGTSFEACCNDHDVAYGTCGTTKAAADAAFLTCMQGVCTAAGNPGCVDFFSNCNFWADEYFEGVTEGNTGAIAQNAYNNAQIDNCDCCDAP